MTQFPPNVLSARCPSRKVFEMLADKWTLLVLAAISRGVHRHNQLLREVGGISQKMLSQTLRTLQRNGLISRTVHPVVPPVVEYAVTPLGDTLIATIGAMGMWAETHFDEVEQARLRYDDMDVAPSIR
jgi:DNA-binding HxlR family transcriptional regulator